MWTSESLFVIFSIISFTSNEQQYYVNIVINKQLLLLFTPCMHYKICVRNFQRHLRTLHASAENLARPLGRGRLFEGGGGAYFEFHIQQGR